MSFDVHVTVRRGLALAEINEALAALEESRLRGKATAIGVAPVLKSTAAPVVGRLVLLR